MRAGAVATQLFNDIAGIKLKNIICLHFEGPKFTHKIEIPENIK
jgi:hypothetical protein